MNFSYRLQLERVAWAGCARREDTRADVRTYTRGRGAAHYRCWRRGQGRPSGVTFGFGSDARVVRNYHKSAGTCRDMFSDRRIACESAADFRTPCPVRSTTGVWTDVLASRARLVTGSSRPARLGMASSRIAELCHCDRRLRGQCGTLLAQSARICSTRILFQCLVHL